MNAVIVLLLLGIVLLVFEVFTPGAVLGVIGALALAGGCGLAFYQFGATSGVLVTIGSAVVLAATFYVEFVLLPKTRLGRKLFQDHAIDATSQPPVAADSAVIGKPAEAITTLAPSGYVMLEGRRYEAWSQSGYTAKGAAVKVVGLDNFRLIVTQS